MKFTYHQGLIWIPIEIVYEGKCFRIENCIVDTGSATTAIDIDLVPFNYKKPAVIRRLCGLGGGTQEVVSQTIDSFSLDAKKLQSVAIEFGDISPYFGIDGFIGNDILHQFTVELDFPNRELILTF